MGGMSGEQAVLAFDTSNYTTSVAAVTLNGETAADRRMPLSVKKGERGLRQSEALFQHIKNLPRLVSDAVKEAAAEGIKICAAAASARPRPVKGSYMPCFLAGTSTGKSIASALGVPYMEFSHQEGHIAAAAGILPENSRSLVFHMSGGTAEVLETRGCVPVQTAGGTKDISYGQLLDRAGTAMGMIFPCGAELDRMAGKETAGFYYSRTGRFAANNPMLCDISVKDGYVNLSGIETKTLRTIEYIREHAKSLDKTNKTDQINNKFTGRMVTELFLRIGDSMLRMLSQCAEKTRITGVICVGGVAASAFLREYIGERQERYGLNIRFGEAGLSSDNAVGIGRLGVNMLRKQEVHFHADQS